MATSILFSFIPFNRMEQLLCYFVFLFQMIFVRHRLYSVQIVRKAIAKTSGNATTLPPTQTAWDRRITSKFSGYLFLMTRNEQQWKSKERDKNERNKGKKWFNELETKNEEEEVEKRREYKKKATKIRMPEVNTKMLPLNLIKTQIPSHLVCVFISQSDLRRIKWSLHVFVSCFVLEYGCNFSALELNNTKKKEKNYSRNGKNEQKCSVDNSFVMKCCNPIRISIHSFLLNFEWLFYFDSISFFIFPSLVRLCFFCWCFFFFSLVCTRWEMKNIVKGIKWKIYF